jgi:glycosyltransferase involved in cell wall biosynthesis
MERGSGRLLYDLAATQPNQAAYHGGGEYAKTVFRAICRHRNGFPLSGFYDPARPLGEEVMAVCGEHKVQLIPLNSGQDVGALLGSGRYTHFFSALPYGYQGLDLSGVTTTWVIHGLRELECFSDEFEWKYLNTPREYGILLKKRLESARVRDRVRMRFKSLLQSGGGMKTVVVPSLHTRYSIVREFPGMDRDRIAVVPSPIKELTDPGALTDDAALLESIGVGRKKFFLITSAGRWIKNAYRAVRTFDEMFESHQLDGMKLVVTGASNLPWKKWRLRHPNRLVTLGYLDNSDLNLLYRDAFAFVYPSLNEGFGYPPVESMFYGTPVLAAATTSLQEVCGEAALFFNPKDTGELKNRVLMLLGEPEMRESLIGKGLARFQLLMDRQEAAMKDLVSLVLRCREKSC